MSYRQSSYDPNAYERPGPPLRPFNWVQWAGVAFGAAGVLFALAWLAGRLGWIEPVFDEAFPGIMLCFAGTMLINSRRAPATPAGTEQLERNRKVLLVTVAALVAVAAAVLVIQFSGA